MDTVRIGIVGVGNMGSVHLGFFADGKIAGAKVTALADTNAEKLRQACRRYPDRYALYDSGEALIDNADVDAVLIATPHYSHPALGMRAFARGLHVLSEKPTGVHALQAAQLNASAEKSGKLFGVMLNQRANPLHMRLHALMQEGAVGELKSVRWIVTNWYRTQHYYDAGGWRATWAGEGGGVRINQAVH